MDDFNIVIITGLSGAGRRTALKALEDAGHFCVDNLPVSLLPRFLELHADEAARSRKLGLGMDLRDGDFLPGFESAVQQLRSDGFAVDVLFLDASEAALLKRYSQTRRQHPLRMGNGLIESIRAENGYLKPIRRFADNIIDTSDLTVHQLRHLIIRHARKGLRTERMRIAVVAFGFKYGVPLEADLLVDVRFMPNPYFVPDLKQLDGKDERVEAYIFQSLEACRFLEKYISLLDYLIPLYENEGKSYLTVAFGCTGGRHRSVTVAEKMASHLKERGCDVSVVHRDIELD
ncbi:MAG: RNase adapter RapZ [Deltaproteobacteria bacterium]|nr:RNase adapter RapZ [Deltaproteobacteria bacterium]MBW1816222.1 RNase adapter RapZ [Deltaproteobacteria bacterium]